MITYSKYSDSAARIVQVFKKARILSLLLVIVASMMVGMFIFSSGEFAAMDPRDQMQALGAGGLDIAIRREINNTPEMKKELTPEVRRELAASIARHGRRGGGGGTP